jgi:hypothetical protein
MLATAAQAQSLFVNIHGGQVMAQGIDQQHRIARSMQDFSTAIVLIGRCLKVRCSRRAQTPQDQGMSQVAHVQNTDHSQSAP